MQCTPELNACRLLLPSLPCCSNGVIDRAELQSLLERVGGGSDEVPLVRVYSGCGWKQRARAGWSGGCRVRAQNSCGAAATMNRCCLPATAALADY